MDFGLAKEIARDTGLSRTGQALGTPSYMPPEQAEGNMRAIGPRSDVYGLGAILYELLTGRPPFIGETALKILRAVSSEEPVAPRRITPDAPRDLETICLKCLEKLPEKRYASAGALAEDLKAWLNGETISARAPTKVERVCKWASKRPAVAALIAVSLLALAALIGGGLWYNAQLAAERNKAVAEAERARAAEAQAARNEREATRRLADSLVLQADALCLASRPQDSLDRYNEAWRALTGLGEPTFAVETGIFELCNANPRPIQTFSGHTLFVMSVAFSADGKLALSGSLDKTLKLWDVATGRELRTFKGHTDLVHSVAFSPDRKLALSGSRDTTLKLWDVATGRELRTFSGHTNEVMSVAFSPDGNLALSGSADKTLKLWELATGRELRTLRGHTELVSSVAFSPDGKLALSGSADRTLKLWDVATGRELRIFSGETEGVLSVAFSPDGNLALSGGADKTLHLRDFTRPARYGEFDALLPKARQALQKNENDPEALKTFGEWYAFRNVNDWAVDFLERARKGGAAISALTLARCYWQKGDSLVASREFKQALERKEAPEHYLGLCIGATERDGKAVAPQPEGQTEVPKPAQPVVPAPVQPAPAPAAVAPAPAPAVPVPPGPAPGPVSPAAGPSPKKKKWVPPAPEPGAQVPAPAAPVPPSPAPAAPAAAPASSSAEEVLKKLREALQAGLGGEPRELPNKGVAFPMQGARTEVNPPPNWSISIYNFNRNQPEVESEGFKRCLAITASTLGLDMTLKPVLTETGKSYLKTESKIGTVSLVRDRATNNSCTIKPLQPWSVQPALPRAAAKPPPRPPENEATGAQSQDGKKAQVVNGLEADGAWLVESWSIPGQASVTEDKDTGNKLLVLAGEGANAVKDTQRSKEKVAITRIGQVLDFSERRELLCRMNLTSRVPVEVAFAFTSRAGDWHETKTVRVTPGKWLPVTAQIAGRVFKSPQNQFKDYHQELQGREAISRIGVVVYSDQPFTLQIDDLFAK